MNSSLLTLPRYYRAFRSLSGCLAGLVSSVPLLSRLLLPDDLRAYGFPPLGTVEVPARILAVVFALAATFLAFFSRAVVAGGNRKRVIGAMVLALIFLFAYVCLFLRFVRTVEIPSKGTEVQVSVGDQRTEFANANFDGESDWELLKYRGTDEEEIWRLWTAQSLLISRLTLYAAYLMLLVSLVTAISWGVLYQMQETQARNG